MPMGYLKVSDVSTSADSDLSLRELHNRSNYKSTFVKTDADGKIKYFRI